MSLSGWIPLLGYTRSGCPATNPVVARMKGWVEKEEAGVAFACSLNATSPAGFCHCQPRWGLERFTKTALLPQVSCLLGKIFHVEREE